VCLRLCSRIRARQIVDSKSSPRADSRRAISRLQLTRPYRRCLEVVLPPRPFAPQIDRCRERIIGSVTALRLSWPKADVYPVRRTGSSGRAGRGVLARSIRARTRDLTRVGPSVDRSESHTTRLKPADLGPYPAHPSGLACSESRFSLSRERLQPACERLHASCHSAVGAARFPFLTDAVRLPAASPRVFESGTCPG
jgi:hypothetical protein